MDHFPNRCYNYPIDKYNFVGLLEKLFDSNDLKKLHEKSTKEHRDLYKVTEDSDTEFHKIFYDKMRQGWDEFLDLYNYFIKEYVSLIFDKKIIYQRWPTFRVHLPNNLAVGAFHKDSEYNHPAGEVNFILPMTHMFESNTVILEQTPNTLDFKQMELYPGELLMFNGNNCLHGNLPNRTGLTRVSLDFRVMLKNHYDPKNNQTSMTTNKKFTLGNYYTDG